MSLVNLLARTAGAQAVLMVMQEELPISIELLDALTPAIPGLCAVLAKHGISEIAGINVSDFTEALSNDEQAEK